MNYSIYDFRGGEAPLAGLIDLVSLLVLVLETYGILGLLTLGVVVIGVLLSFVLVLRSWKR